MNETIQRVSYYVYPGLELNGNKHLFQKQNKKMKVEDVAELVCRYFQIESKVFYSRFKGKQRITDARKIVCYLCNKILKISSTEIALTINRDHSSVIFGVHKADNLITVDEVFAKDVYKLTQMLFN